jgi:hypothetical protein
MCIARLRTAAFLLLLSLALPTVGSAQLPVSGSAELTYKTGYLFAGIPFALDDVTQAHAQVAVGSFTVHGFSTYDHDASDLIELDVYGDYYVQFAPTVGGFVGAALYGFKFVDGWKTTPELYAGLVLTAPLNPTLYVAHDFDLGDGTHATLSVSEEVPLGLTGVTLGLGGNLDYNDSYWDDFWLVTGSESGFSFADFTVSLGIPVGPLTVKPMVIIQRAIHDDFFDDEVVGVSASMVF